MSELSIIQKTYDFIKWYIPILNHLPRNHKFTLGDRLINNLYDLLQGLVEAKYSYQKLDKLKGLNLKLELIRYQSRLLFDFQVIAIERYQYIFEQIQELGIELGSWIKQQEKDKCNRDDEPQKSANKFTSEQEVLELFPYQSF